LQTLGKSLVYAANEPLDGFTLDHVVDEFQKLLPER
jgi:hypothetical protein